VRSRDEGILMVLPREGGTGGLYVELDRLATTSVWPIRHGRAGHHRQGQASSAVRARREGVVWWSIYEIGHRSPTSSTRAGQRGGTIARVMLAGDAATRTAESRAGHERVDGRPFNLGWKLISVLRARDASLLHSYSGERRAAAKGLVEFDHRWARWWRTRRRRRHGQLAGVAREFVRQPPFTCGLTIRYERSALTGAAGHQALAAGFDIGKRFHSAPVVRLADARPMHLGHCIEADARWRLFLFAPALDAGGAGGTIASLCDWLEHDPASPVRRHTAPDEDVDAVIDTRAVFQPGSHELDYAAMPALLRPHVGRYGLCDYEKVFCVDAKRGEDIFAMRGIDRAAGCMVVVRPDQYVGHVLPLSARDELASYFAGVLRVRG